jgi:hypothetical protein
MAPYKIKKENSIQKRDHTAFSISAAGVALLILNAAVAGEGMQMQRRKDLNTAMQSEALSVLKCTAFAQHARKEDEIALAEILE